MSLITFKDGVMTGDKRDFLGNLYSDGNVVKVNKFDGCLFGSTGALIKIREVLDWLQSDRNSSYPDSSGEAAILVYDGEKLLRYCGSKRPSEHPANKPFADGPDMSVGIALGAMYAGMSAEEANLLSQKLTITCGGGVDVVSLKNQSKIDLSEAIKLMKKGHKVTNHYYDPDYLFYDESKKTFYIYCEDGDIFLTTFDDWSSCDRLKKSWYLAKQDKKLER